MEQEHRGIRQETDPNRREYPVEVYRGEAGRPKQGKTGLRLYATEAVQRGADILPNAHVKTIRMFTDTEWVNNNANARIEKWERLCNELLDALGDGYFFVTMASGTRAIKLAKPLGAGESASEDGRLSFADMVGPAVLHRRELFNRAGGGQSRGPRKLPPASASQAADERAAAEALAGLQHGRSASLTDAPASSVDNDSSAHSARRQRESDGGSASGSAPRRQRMDDGGSAAVDRSAQTRELLQKLDSVINSIIAGGCVDQIPKYAIKCGYIEDNEDELSWWVEPGIIVSGNPRTEYTEKILEIPQQKVWIYSKVRAIDGYDQIMNTVTVEFPATRTKSECELFCKQLFSMLATGWFVHSNSLSGVRVAKYVDLNHTSRRLEETLRRVHEALDTI